MWFNQTSVDFNNEDGMMFPIQYIEPVFRPPSEAKSLILPVTNGCSWNECTFCDMYTQPQKKFRPFAHDDIVANLERMSAYPVRRVFLADGDAMALSTKRLLAILEAIQKHLPNVERVSSYCLPNNVKNKSVAELKELQDAGLALAYIGCESGDDEVLRLVNKSETFASSLSCLEKLGEAGIKRSVMILNGLGGKKLSPQHALNSARLMNAAPPEFLSTLVVSFPLGLERFKSRYPDFEMLTQQELFLELYYLISQLDLPNTVFRSDHASNYLVLKGRLGRDQARLLQQLQHAIDSPQLANLRPEWARGL
ncbi:radical SAM protein [Vitreoscilla stercoraria]|uniref:Radical SAM protein n=1 Tax=Vitreoscilla stercoraria TaxID=61 RepID=A0ABY4ECJ5_VITST|nr:radical SAM protein [Vitreoscilla stercoraria]UOO93140.1 radical SAM protein [Vitreoscilla stercoraria]